MTHSLKVAQVARRLAEGLKSQLNTDDIQAAGGLDEDVAETAGLCHDLGHPPFGHAAEGQLQRILAGENDHGLEEEDGFEGNAQSFRIVTRTSKRDRHSGLNLTAASLAAILKYPWSRSQVVGHSRDKFGYYKDDQEDFLHARSFLTGKENRQSLEASVMEWADDVSYAIHDIEDAFRCQLIPLDRIYWSTTCGDGRERDRFISWYAAYRCRNGNGQPLSTKTIDETIEALATAPGAPRQPFGNTNQELWHQSRHWSQLLTRFLKVGEDGIGVNPNAETRSLVIPELSRMQVDLLKSMMVCYVYESPGLVAQQIGQQRIITELFCRLYEATAPRSRTRGVIPPPFQEDLTDSLSQSQRVRLAIDVITSLTEQQAIDFYERLTGHTIGSVRDYILY